MESFCLSIMDLSSSGEISEFTPFIMNIGFSFFATSAVMYWFDSPIFLRVAWRCASQSKSTRSLLFDTNFTAAGAKFVSLKDSFDLQADSVSAEVAPSFLEEMMRAGLVTGSVVSVDGDGGSLEAVRTACA